MPQDRAAKFGEQIEQLDLQLAFIEGDNIYIENRVIGLGDFAGAHGTRCGNDHAENRQYAA